MYQQIIIIGNLGGNPEMRYNANGKAVTNFSVATNRVYNGEKETIWFRVSVWGNQAEACNTYLRRGSKVLVEGRLTADTQTGGPRIWTANDGEPRASYEITANQVKFLSTRGDDAAGHDDGYIPF